MKTLDLPLSMFSDFENFFDFEKQIFKVLFNPTLSRLPPNDEKAQG